MTEAPQPAAAADAAADAVADAGRAAAPLTARVAGQAVMIEALAAQESAPERGWWARLTGRSPLTKEARPWYLGAVGEARVAQLLARLGPEWTVLHAVPGAGAADVDHVLIGPAGVITVTTKNYGPQRVWVAGKDFLVAGERTQDIRDAEREAKRAAKLLSAATGTTIRASAMIVVVDPKMLVVREKPASVAVVTSSGMLRALRGQSKRGPVVAAANLKGLRAAAADPRTWHCAPDQALDVADLQTRFGRLRQSVSRAHRARLIWRFLGMVTVISAAFAAYLIIATGLLETST